MGAVLNVAACGIFVSCWTFFSLPRTSEVLLADPSKSGGRFVDPIPRPNGLRTGINAIYKLSFVL